MAASSSSHPSISRESRTTSRTRLRKSAWTSCPTQISSQCSSFWDPRNFSKRASRLVLARSKHWERRISNALSLPRCFTACRGPAMASVKHTSCRLGSAVPSSSLKLSSMFMSDWCHQEMLLGFSHQEILLCFFFLDFNDSWYSPSLSPVPVDVLLPCFFQLSWSPSFSTIYVMLKRTFCHIAVVSKAYKQKEVHVHLNT